MIVAARHRVRSQLRLQADAAASLSGVVRLWDENQFDVRPSRSNCSDHSADTSRKAATPMPRGSRPSTAALTRPGAMKAIETVMLTRRTLHIWRAAIASTVVLPETMSSSQARPRAMDLRSATPTLEFDWPHFLPFDSCRQQDLLEPLGRRFGPWDQEGRGSLHGQQVDLHPPLVVSRREPSTRAPARFCAHFYTGDIRAEACRAFAL